MTERTTIEVRRGLVADPAAKHFHAMKQAVWLDLYRRDWITPELPSNTRHRRVFTY